MSRNGAQVQHRGGAGPGDCRRAARPRRHGRDRPRRSPGATAARGWQNHVDPERCRGLFDGHLIEHHPVSTSPTGSSTPAPSSSSSSRADPCPSSPRTRPRRTAGPRSTARSTTSPTGSASTRGGAGPSSAGLCGTDATSAFAAQHGVSKETLTSASPRSSGGHLGRLSRRPTRLPASGRGRVQIVQGRWSQARRANGPSFHPFADTPRQSSKAMLRCGATLAGLGRCDPRARGQDLGRPTPAKHTTEFEPSLRPRRRPRGRHVAGHQAVRLDGVNSMTVGSATPSRRSRAGAAMPSAYFSRWGRRICSNHCVDVRSLLTAVQTIRRANRSSSFGGLPPWTWGRGCGSRSRQGAPDPERDALGAMGRDLAASFRGHRRRREGQPR